MRIHLYNLGIYKIDHSLKIYENICLFVHINLNGIRYLIYLNQNYFKIKLR